MEEPTDAVKPNQRPLDQVVAQTERLGVIGSPSSTSELAVDVVGTAVGRKLVGELAMFPFKQDGVPHYALGQITEIELRNVWHEDPTMRSLIRQRGRIDAVSERQDTHLGKMTISAVFKHTAISPGPTGQEGGISYEPSIMGTVPSTGTAIHLVNDNVLEAILHRYRDQIFYLGQVYGSTPKLPLWFKHFDRGPDGAGEAYHIGIFGKTGSGKSVLAKMALCAYMRYPQMGLVILDPQGEFAKDFHGGGSGEMRIPLADVAKLLKKQVAKLSVRNLVLDRWELFEEILFESNFFHQLTMPKGDNRHDACAKLSDELQKKKVKLEDLNGRAAFNTAWAILADQKVQQIFYRTPASRERFETARADADQDDFFERYWKPVTALFDKSRAQARTVEAALNWVLDAGANGVRPILVIDLSRETAHGLLWNDTIQSLVIKRLLDGITMTAERRFQDGNEKGLNTLVLIDEAHRLAPRQLPENGNAAGSVRNVLIDAVRTTRKYGLGWLFISQTLSSLHSEILQQLRIQFFGFGLSMGQEFQALRQLVGGDDSALRLYGLFRDPHSSFDIASRQYSFMTTGPISPLSFAGTPLFLNAFNHIDQFTAANGLTLGGSSAQ